MLADALAPPRLAPEAGTAGLGAGSGCAVLGCAEAIIDDDACGCAAGAPAAPLLEACEAVFEFVPDATGVTVLAADSVEV